MEDKEINLSDLISDSETDKGKKVELLNNKSTKEFNESVNLSDIVEVDDDSRALYDDRSTVSKVDVDKYKDYMNIVFENEGLDEARAQGQNNWERSGRALANIGTELTLGTLKGITDMPDVLSYLFAGGKVGKEQFENDISKAIGELKEDWNQDIYRERASQGFSPGHFSWWSENLPSIASAATFIIPTMAVGKGISMVGQGAKGLTTLGKAQKGLKYLDEFSVGLDALKGSKALQAKRMIANGEGAFTKFAKSANEIMKKTTPVIGGTVYSNAAESFQEAAPIAIEKYNKAKDKFMSVDALRLKAEGMSDEEIEGQATKFASDVASEVGSEIYMRNLVNAPLDLFSTASLFKTFKMTQVDLVGKAFKKKVAKSLLTEVIPEGVQEGVNFISSAEAKKAADAMIDGKEYSSNGFNKFITEYYKDSDAQTAMFFGALGGAFFDAVGVPVKEKLEGMLQDKSIKEGETYRKGLQKQYQNDISALAGNEAFFKVGKDEELHEKVYEYSKAGSMDKFYAKLEDLESRSPEELSTLGIEKGQIQKIKEKAEKIEEQFIKIEQRFGSDNFSNPILRDANKKLSESIWKQESFVAQMVETEDKIADLALEVEKDYKNLGFDATNFTGVINRKKINSKVKSLNAQKSTLLSMKKELQYSRSSISQIKENTRNIDKMIKGIDKELEEARIIKETILGEVKENTEDVTDEVKIESALMNNSQAYYDMAQEFNVLDDLKKSYDIEQINSVNYASKEYREKQVKEFEEEQSKASIDHAYKIREVNTMEEFTNIKKKITEDKNLSEEVRADLIGKLEVQAKLKKIVPETILDKAKNVVNDVTTAVKEVITPTTVETPKVETTEEKPKSRRGLTVDVNKNDNVDVQEKIEVIKEQLLKLNEKKFVVNPENSNEYLDEKGVVYNRISTLNGVKDFKNNEASNRGTIIDALFRNFISEDIKTLTDLKNDYKKIDKGEAFPFTDDFLKELYNIFTDIKKITNNLELISTVPTLWGEIKGKKYAGTIDLLGINKETGKVYIIDLKTSTQNRRDKSGRYYDSMKSSDSNQQSGYAELLYQTTGIRVAGITLLPIQVKSKNGKYESVKANKDGDIFTLLAEVNKDIYPNKVIITQHESADDNTTALFTIGKKYAESLEIAGETGQEYKEIPVEDIDFKGRGLKEDTIIEKIVLLEEKKINEEGEKIVTVDIHTNKRIATLDVVLKNKTLATSTQSTEAKKVEIERRIQEVKKEYNDKIETLKKETTTVTETVTEEGKSEDYLSEDKKLRDKMFELSLKYKIKGSGNFITLTENGEFDKAYYEGSNSDELLGKEKAEELKNGYYKEAKKIFDKAKRVKEVVDSQLGKDVDALINNLGSTAAMKKVMSENYTHKQIGFLSSVRDKYISGWYAENVADGDITYESISKAVKEQLEISKKIIKNKPGSITKEVTKTVPVDNSAKIIELEKKRDAELKALKESTQSTQSTKSNLPALTEANRERIFNKYGRLFDSFFLTRDGSSILSKALANSNWKDNIKISVDKNINYKGKNAFITVKYSHLAVANMKNIVKLEVKVDGKWVYVGELLNPNRYVGIKINTVKNTPAYSDIDFSKLLEDEKLTTWFKNTFAIESKVRDDKGNKILTPFTNAQILNFKTDYIAKKELFKAIDIVYNNNIDKETDISHLINVQLFGKNPQNLSIAKAIPLTDLVKEGNTINQIVDIKEQLNILENSGIDKDFKGAIEKANNMNAPARYLALITQKNGLKVAVPVRPKTIATKKATSLLKQVNKEWNIAKEITNEKTRKDKVVALIKRLNSELYFDKTTPFKIFFDYSFLANKADITIHFENDTVSKHTKLNSLTSKELLTQINTFLTEQKETNLLSEDNLRGGMVTGKAQKAESFESLFGEGVFNDYSFTVEAKTDNVKEVISDKLEKEENKAVAKTEAFSAVSSIEEIQLKIKSLKTAKVKAIENKNIKLADELNAQIKQLSRDLANAEDAIIQTKEVETFDDAIDKVSNGTVYSDKGVADAIDYINKNLPSFISVKQFERVVKGAANNNVTLGWFHKNVIGLAKGTEAGIGYHESFHAVFRTLLTTSEQNNFLSSIIPSITDKDISDFLEERPKYANRSQEDILRLIAEERLADLFQQHVEGKEKDLSNISPLFRGLFKFFRDLMDWFSKSDDIKVLFKRIDSGYFRNSKIVRNQFTEGNVELIEKVLKGVPYNVSSEIIKGIASEIANEGYFVDKSQTNSEALDNAVRRIIDRELDIYIEDFETEVGNAKAKTIVRGLTGDVNEALILSEVRNILKSYEVNTVEKERLDEEDSGEVEFDKFNVANYESGFFQNVSGEIKQFLGLTTIKVYDRVLKMERIKVVNLSTLYPVLQKNIGSLSWKEQIKVMEKLGRGNEQVQAVYEKLVTKFNGIQDENFKPTEVQEAFLTRFEKAFESTPVDSMQVLQNIEEGIVKVFAGNKRSGAKINVSKWKQNYDSFLERTDLNTIEKSNLLKRGSEEVIHIFYNVANPEFDIEQGIRTIQGHFNNFGIDLSSEYVRYSLESAQEELDVKAKLNKKVKGQVLPLTITDIRNIANSFTIGKFENLYEGNISSKGSVGTITKIGENDSFFRDDLYETSYRDAAGKMRYVYVLPSHLSVKTTQLVKDYQDSSVIDKVKEGNTYESYNYLFQNFDSETLAKYFSTMKMAITGDVKEEITLKDDLTREKEGTTYKTTDGKSLILNQIAMFENGWITPFVISDKSSIFSIKFSDSDNIAISSGFVKDGKITDEAVNIFYNSIFMQEFQRLQGNFSEYETKSKTKDWINFIQFKNNPIIDNVLNIERIKEGKNKGELAKDFRKKLNTDLNEEQIKTIKAEIRKALLKDISKFKNVLLENDIISKNDKNEYSSNLIFKNKNLTEAISDYFLADLLMTTSISQLIQGDLSKAKNLVDRVKRNAGEAAYGNSFKGKFNAAYRANQIRNLTAGELDETIQTKINNLRNKPETEKTIAEIAKLEIERDTVLAKIDADDAQNTITTKFWKKMMMEQGRLRTENDFEYINKMIDGVLTDEELEGKYLLKGDKKHNVNIDLISIKDVYYDGDRYNKDSSFTLIKQLTSYLPKKDAKIHSFLLELLKEHKDKDTINIAELMQGLDVEKDKTKLKYLEEIRITYGFSDMFGVEDIVKVKDVRVGIENMWQPLRGLEHLHNQRKWMETHDIDVLIPPSASKLYTPENILDKDFFKEETFNEANLEEGTIVPEVLNGKFLRLQVENKSSTSDNPRITAPTQLEVLIDTEMSDTVIFDYEGGTIGSKLKEKYYNLLAKRTKEALRIRSIEFENLLDNGKVRDISVFLKRIRESIEDSSPNEHLLQLLTTAENGDSEFDLNLPHIIAKVKQGFLNSFKTDVLSQKVSGRKLTLVSDFGIKVAYDDNGIIDYEKVKANPEQYKNTKTRPLKIHRRGDGKIEYAEVMITRGQAQLLGIKIGDISPELLKMLGTRIPTQTHHSMIPMKVVGFLPEIYGDVVTAPNALSYLSGSDYDIDKLFVMMRDKYRIGNTVKSYGDATSVEQQWEEYQMYYKNNNKTLKSLVSDMKLNAEKVSTKEEKVKQEEGFYIEVFVKVGLISTLDEFKKSEDKSNPGAINNDLLNIQLSMLTNESMINSVFTPATMDGLEHDAKFMEIHKGLELEGTFLNSPLGKYLASMNNITGSRNIGIAASGNKVSAALTKAKAKLNPIYAPAFDNNIYSDFGVELEYDVELRLSETTEDWSLVKNPIRKEGVSRRKADTFSSFVSAMTDNAKVLVANKMNFTDDNLGVFLNMVSLGVGRTRVGLFANQPAIIAISNDFIKTKSAIAPLESTKASIILEETKKYFNKYLRLSGVPAKEIPFINSIKDIKDFFLDTSLNLDSKQLYDNIVKAKPESIEFIKSQLMSLLTYSNMAEVSNLTFALNSVVSLNKGVDSDMNKFNSLVEKLKSIDVFGEGTTEESIKNNDILNVKKIIDENSYYSQQVQVVKDIENFSQYMFLEKSKGALKLKEILKESVSKTFTNRESFEKEFNKGLLSYLSAKALDAYYKELGANVELKQLNTLLYQGDMGGSTIVNKFNTLKKYEAFRNNDFVKYLIPISGKEKVKGKDGKETIEFTKKGYDYLEGSQTTIVTPEITQNLINAFDTLMTANTLVDTGNPIEDAKANTQIRNFAKQLRAYFIVKDGMQFKGDSPIMFTSPDLYKPISDKLKVLSLAFTKDSKMEYEKALGTIGLTYETFTEEFSDIFFRWKGNETFTETVPLTNVDVQTGIRVLNTTQTNAQVENIGESVQKIIKEGEVNRVKIIVGGERTPKSIKYIDREGARQYIFPTFIKAGGKLHKLNVVTKEGNLEVADYSEIRYEGNFKQSPYHNDLKSFADITDYLGKKKLNVVYNSIGIIATPLEKSKTFDTPAEQNAKVKEKAEEIGFNLVASLPKGRRTITERISPTDNVVSDDDTTASKNCNINIE